MIHNLNQLDFQTVLAYDRLVLHSTSFKPEQKWAINTERSLLLQNNRHDNRTSFLTAKTVRKIKGILQQIEAHQWTAPNIFSVEN